jgi:hypothetical protein
MPTAIRIKNSLLMPQYLHVAPYARLTYARTVDTRLPARPLGGSATSGWSGPSAFSRMARQRL